MGFPSWTLWGMGISGAGVLLMLVLSYIAQTPRLIKRLGLAGLRLDLRARTFTGFALALLLLSLGFFLAGVPLDGSQPAGVAEAEATLPVTEGEESGALADSTENGETAVPNTTPDGTSRPESGAFGGPPPAARTATAEAALAAEAIVEETTAEATSIPENTETPTPTTTPSPTPSPTPTMTPTPTQTPTPIFEDTAIINIGSSTLWLKRTPGGQDDHLVRGGDVVILLSGHANMGGTMWREVQTVDGVVGWVLDSYLAIDEDVSS